MRILLSNDDGIYAQGLSVLEDIARQFSDDIWIVAPEMDQSGASHSLTLSTPLRVRELSSKRFAVLGTPTDCVVFATYQLMKDHLPDLILSGVNNGSNLADDVIYSGTIAAAAEGVSLKIPSIALSLSYKDSDVRHWETARNFGPKVIQKLLDKPWDPSVLMNINFPACPSDHVKGIRVVEQGERKLGEDILLKRIDPRGKPYYWVGAVDYDDEGRPGTDLEAIYHDYISVTPLSFHLTHAPTMAILEKMF